MEAEKTCSKCVSYGVCSRIAVDYQMREKWNCNARNNGNNGNGNGYKNSEDFFRFMAEDCEFFFFGESGKITENRELVPSSVNGS